MDLSYSSLQLLHTCPRAFEQEKMLTPDNVRMPSLDLVAGSALGSGLQALLMGKSLEQAGWAAYKDWSFPKDSRSLDIFEASRKKSFAMVLMHLEKFHLSQPLNEWRLWELPSGRPAVEVSFRVKLPTGDNYRGYIDAILYRENETGATELCALEIKSSGFKDPNIALYQNSFQGFSYGAIVDVISKRVNDLQIFFVCTFPELEQLQFQFYRSQKDKLSWLPALGLDIQAIAGYKEARHFPMRGDSCFNFFRPCAHLGVCNLDKSNDWIEQPEDKKTYDFEFELSELLQTLEEISQ